MRRLNNNICFWINKLVSAYLSLKYNNKCFCHYLFKIDFQIKLKILKVLFK